MNVFIFSGTVTSDPKIINNAARGYTLSFHVNIPTISKNKFVWAQCNFSGKKAKDIADDIWAGQIVTVRGEVLKRDEDEGGPIRVMAKDVVAHDIDYRPEDAVETIN